MKSRISEDITERKQARKFKTLFETSRDAIMTLEPPSWRFTSGNPATVKMFGAKDEGHFISHGPWQVSPEHQPDGRLSDEKAKEMIDIALREGSNFFEWTHKRINGENFPATVLLSRMEQDGKQILQATVRDISERKKTEVLRRSEAKLRAADTRKSEFIAVLSHELRNPLAAISSGLRVLDQAGPGGEMSRQTRVIIDRQVVQMKRLIDDLLEISRIEYGKFHLEEVKRLDLNRLVVQAVEDFHPIFKEKGVGLEWTPAANPLWIDGDTARLVQLIGNLLSNAVKFTLTGGRVTVVTLEEVSTGRVVLRVKDTGVGISPDLLGKLFEPFMQAPQLLDRSWGGLGLGLSLVKGIAELHGGDVEVRCDGIGKGTEFIVYLPLRKEAVAKPSVPKKTPYRKKRILIIEDHHDTALLLRWALEMRHHEVEVASDGQDGLLKARQFRPEVVLCDIGLPGMDGYEVAKAMRADPDLNRIKLIALSGYAQPEHVTKAREAGFDRHLAKPSSLDEIERAMEEQSHH